MKSTLKIKAVQLRKQGLSYSEILKRIPIAKSTLSEWLYSVGLSKKQKQRLTLKRLIAAKKGSTARKTERLLVTEQIKRDARLEINKITKRELWLMGISLYWAEGAKQKDHNPSQGVVFSNSDIYLVRIFIKWLKLCLHINNSRIFFEIYIHENWKDRIDSVRKFWSVKTGFPYMKFDKIYFKRGKLNTVRKNTGFTYHGLLRIRVMKSTNINRQISGWIDGICDYCGVV